MPFCCTTPRLGTAVGVLRFGVGSPARTVCQLVRGFADGLHGEGGAHKGEREEECCEDHARGEHLVRQHELRREQLLVEDGEREKEEEQRREESDANIRPRVDDVDEVQQKHHGELQQRRHVKATWDFEDGLDGWANASATEMEAEVHNRGGELRGVVTGSRAAGSAPHIDSPRMAITVDDRHTLVFRMLYR